MSLASHLLPLTHVGRAVSACLIDWGPRSGQASGPLDERVIVWLISGLEAHSESQTFNAMNCSKILDVFLGYIKKNYSSIELSAKATSSSGFYQVLNEFCIRG